MLSTTRSTASMALRGWSPRTSRRTFYSGTDPWTARPMTALLPYRAGSVAFLSNTSSSPAQTMQTPGLVSGNPGTPPPMKAGRREVPLPSQEGKQGAMQYALYVGPFVEHIFQLVMRDSWRDIERLTDAMAAQRSIKSRTGRARALSGP
jgi:hypothetical protein